MASTLDTLEIVKRLKDAGWETRWGWIPAEQIYDRASQTLVLHWDGFAWSIVPNPNPPVVVDATLNAIAAVSANDVWAVGFYASSGIYQPLIEHWDGSAWSVAPSPNLSTEYNQLNAVAAMNALEFFSKRIDVRSTSPVRTFHPLKTNDA